MFRFLMLCCLLLSTQALAKDYRPDRQIIVQSPCTVPFVTKYGVKNCVIIGEHVRVGGDPGLRGGINWDSRPSALMTTKTKHFALVYYFTDNPDREWKPGQVSVWDRDKFMNISISNDNPGIIFRITRDGGKTWSRFYTTDTDPNSNYRAQ